MKAQAAARIPQIPVEVAASFLQKRLQVRIKTLNTELWEQRKRKSSNRQKGYEQEKHSREANRSKLYK